MSEFLKPVFAVEIALRDAILALAGQRRVTLGEWPEQGLVEAAVAAIEESGGRRIEGPDAGLAFDVEYSYYRVSGRRIKLCVEEYGEVSLWGAKGVVAELSRRVAERLSTREKQGSHPAGEPH